MKRGGPLAGFVYALPLSLALWGAIAISGCALTRPSTNPDYTLCDADNCADPANVTISND